MYDFKTDPHFECIGHLTTRDTDVAVSTEGWAAEADGRTILWFDRHQYFCRNYKSHLIAEIAADGGERVVYHDMLADTFPVEPGKSYHVWIMAVSARSKPDGKLWVEKAPSGQGHVMLYRRVAADDAVLSPTNPDKKKSAWREIFRKS